MPNTCRTPCAARQRTTSSPPVISDIPFRSVFFASSWFVPKSGGAEIRERAVRAVRLAGVADPAAMEDQAVRDTDPAVARDEGHQVALDLDRVVVLRQTQAPREPPDMGVHGDSLRQTVGGTQH